MAETTGHAVAFAFPEIEPSTVQSFEAAPAGPSPVELALEEADAIREAARQDGFAAGRAEAAEMVAAAITALHAAAHEVSTLRGGMADAVEDAAVDLALRIADQVLQGELEAHPELVVGVVRGALRRLVERERVTVLVHPEDLDAVRAAAPDLIAQLGGIEHLEVQAERRLARGGAAVRTQEGEVDATLETKLARVREVLAERTAERDADAAHADDAHMDPASPDAAAGPPDEAEPPAAAEAFGAEPSAASVDTFHDVDGTADELPGPDPAFDGADHTFDVLPSDPDA
jgi:flagellar assembly protein FliH